MLSRQVSVVWVTWEMCLEDGVDNTAAHVCAGAARRQAVLDLNPCCAFFSSLLAFVFARWRPSLDNITFKPDS